MPEAEKQRLGRALRLLRDSQPMTQRQWAQRFRVSQSSVSKVELGKQSIAADLLMHIVETFHLTLDGLLALPETAPDLRPWHLAGARMTPARRAALLDVNRQWDEATDRGREVPPP